MDKKNYAKKCGKLSKQYGISFEVCLVLGTDDYYYKELLKCIERLNELNTGGYYNTMLQECLVKELRSENIKDNLVALDYSLGSLYSDLNLKNNEKKIKRLSNYLYNTVKWPACMTFGK